ncbi:MAG: hypothetical protein M3550_17190 [Actinomycetota bacterium]|nr:hypothetical protein [Actinomycetota bacterium]
MKARLGVLLLLALALAVAAVSGAGADSKRHEYRGGAHQGDLDLPDRLDLPPGWQPEGIAAGRHFDLYVGSIPTGAVLRLDARTGATETVVPGGPGRAAIGLKLDYHKRLFVTGGPTGKPSCRFRQRGIPLVERASSPVGVFDRDVLVRGRKTQ